MTNTNDQPTAEGEDCPAAVSLAGLARTIEALDHRGGQLAGELAQVGKRADDLAALVTRLAQQVTAQSTTNNNDGPSKVAPSWLDIDAESPSRWAGQEILDRLNRWVAGVYLRYSDARLPDCWL
jgi:hypothetical protein